MGSSKLKNKSRSRRRTAITNLKSNRRLSLLNENVAIESQAVPQNSFELQSDENYEKTLNTDDESIFCKNNSAELNIEENSPSSNESRSYITNTVNNNKIAVSPQLSDGYISGSSDSTHEESINDVQLDFNNIIDLNHLLSELRKYFKPHSNCNKGMNDIYIAGSHKQGMRTHLMFRCRACKCPAVKIWSCPDKPNIGLGLNLGAVAGTLTSGMGYATLKEMTASLNINCMTEKTYISYRTQLSEIIKKMAKCEFAKAAHEEFRLAKEAGELTPDGKMAEITVIIDATWSKRSYRNGNYNASSCAGVIVGARTGKIIFCEVDNKSCGSCNYAEKHNREPKPHDCRKNYVGASTGMETDILRRGFASSMNDFNLIYSTIIADGDSSCVNTIQNDDPYKIYNIEIQKIECRNHLHRNLSRKMSDISKKKLDQLRPKKVGEFRKYVDHCGYLMRKFVENAVSQRNEEDVCFEEKIDNLTNDILSMTHHFFGPHTYCPPNKEECKAFPFDYLNVLEENHWLEYIEEAVEYLSRHADSLLENETNNLAEGVNSNINKPNASKRFKFTDSISYELRVLCGSVQFNSQDVVSKIIKYSNQIVPSIVSDMEKSRQIKVDGVRVSRQKNGPTQRLWANTDEDYGKSVRPPAMSKAKYDFLFKRHWNLLNSNQQNWVNIEKNTRGQAKCPLWRELRKKILTASRFGEICCAMNANNVGSLKNKVWKFIKPHSIDNKYTRLGKISEPKAINQLMEETGCVVEGCGLFIDSMYSQLGASPDGVLNDGESIIEIKTLAKYIDEDPVNAIEINSRYRSFFASEDLTEMNVKHEFYYQVQGQLHVTQRKYCIFTVYTNKGIHFIEVERDDVFWETEMKEQLLTFYEDWLLPELIDPRAKRADDIRVPDYMQKFIQAQTTTTTAQKKRKKNDPNQRPWKIFRNNCNSSVHTLDINTTNDSLPVTAMVDLPFNQSDDDIIEEIVATIDEKAVINNLLPRDSLLNDDSIQLFMNILASTVTDIIPARVLHLSHPHLIRPSSTNEDFAIIGGGSTEHWCFIYEIGGFIKVYDSGSRTEYSQFSDDEKLFIKKRYPSVKERHIEFKKMKTTQPDKYSCGVYAAAFATCKAIGDDPETISYSMDVIEMRKHMIHIIQSKQLYPFPINS